MLVLVVISTPFLLLHLSSAVNVVGLIVACPILVKPALPAFTVKLPVNFTKSSSFGTAPIVLAVVPVESYIKLEV